MLDDRTKALIRALLYPVQFEKRPEQGSARVMDLVVEQNALNATPSEYWDAIELALDSDERLSALLPRSHDEETVRHYLRDLGDLLLDRVAAMKLASP
jgi:ribosome assembly protein YihI (activator of Der GTPase)